MLRLINILILFIASAATAAASTATAGDFGCRWMSHPAPDDTSHVWFRRTLVIEEPDMPRTAYIHVATTGRFVLYVNGRNVSTALFTPDRTPNDTTVMAISYDVRRFLRPDSNTIALLYCPSTRTRRQVSVSFYGIAADSSHFATNDTDGWLCRHADTWQTHDGGEAMNRNTYPYRWTDTDQPLALWQAVEQISTSQHHTTSTPHHHNTSTSQHLNTTPSQHNTTSTPISAEDICGYSPVHINPLVDNAAHMRRIYTPLFTEQSADTLIVHLVPNERHLIRITLRGCRRGERISIGNLHYVCTGEIDEQAFARFTPTSSNTIIITGDSHFRSEQVQEVESICL
ncbi:alpha-L-rhamnosidase N-terminal domain-containing protein [Leyella stercorea]|uniref:alpha-L-rhamnosidase N-terminal domain-containing protein n=1 Tax=Leyella stercorea TaxID=363265 RepID=UPI00242DD342|nr:alpha-L-rhamnosidase N-terminal domain-containing protein [Leyella stercorea]